MPSPQQYWREIPQRHRLEAGECVKCHEIYFPPRLVCASCHGRQFQTVRLPDTGKIDTFTVIHVATKQFADLAPYALAIVELTNGVKITSQVVDCDPSTLAIGQKVKIEFRKIQQEGEAGILCYGYKCTPQ